MNANRDPLFHCNRRDMPVAKDCSDCAGCPLRLYPSPCEQFAYYFQEMKKGKLGYTPSIYSDLVPPPDITEKN